MSKPRSFDDLRPAAEPMKSTFPPEVLVAFQRVFATPDGEMVLEWLRMSTTRAANGPDVTDSALRHIEGQRFLVRRIEDLANPEKKQ